MDLPKNYYFCVAHANWDASLPAFLEYLGTLVSIMKHDVIKTLWKQISQTK